jgi:hypothetical protein
MEFTSGYAEDPERETRANKFMIDLLMPAPWLKKDVNIIGSDPYLLARRYELGEPIVWHRLGNLNLV